MAHRDTRVPSADECVLRNVLERMAHAQPTSAFAWFEDSAAWSYAETLAIVRETAAGLRALGVRQGDLVLSWLPNGADALRIWFAINYLGAVYVPVNLSYRGAILSHIVRDSGARLMIAHADLLPRLHEIDLGILATVVAMDGDPIEIRGVNVLSAEALKQTGDAVPLPDKPIEPWDLQSIIYTSGTTGPSKGVRSSYVHLHACNCGPYDQATSSDRNLIQLPLFHVGGTVNVYAMLLRGASIAVVDSFRIDTFWNLVRQSGATISVILGSMSTLLMKQRPRADEADSGLRIALVIPLSEDAAAFSRRFGCDVYTLFNMTEVSCPIVSERNPAVAGTCGKLREGIEARLVDGNDCEVPKGSLGELILRADAPWTLSDGYHNNPEATAAAWRNGWFHTGDVFREDADGNFFFVDRRKDSIRRRGENISSVEVETEVCAHPGVREAAVVGVRNEDGEEEVLAVIAPVGGKVDPEDLVSFLGTRMAHFMVPRYIRQMRELPKTPTQKVRKNELRSQGITPDTWDREAAGIIIKREKVGRAHRS